MRTTTKIIIFGGTHHVPEGWDLIIRCKLKSGDKWLKPWGEWVLIPKPWYNEYHEFSKGQNYFIRKKPHSDIHIMKLIDVIRKIK